MSGSGRDALLDVRMWSGGPRRLEGVVRRHPGCPGVVGKPSQMSGSGLETRPEVREWSERPSGCQGVAGRPSVICGSGREALPDVQEWSGGPPG